MLELIHLLAEDKPPEAIDAASALLALATDHEDTVWILLPLKDLQ